MKARLLAILLGILLFVSITLVFANGDNLIKIYPSDDSYVDAYNPSKNYGNSTSLIVGRESGTKRSYLKFNLSSLTCDAIQQATLKIYSTSASKEYVGAYKTSEFYKDSNQQWNESGINWNNAPTDFEFLDSLNISSTGYKSFNVTKAASEAFEGSKILSISLKFLNETGKSAVQYFYSKDTSCHNWDPYLEVLCAYYECKSDEDCKPNYCSQTYFDYCEGRKLVDFNSNKILDNITTENSCENSCQENHTCTNCTPDCLVLPVSYCVKGVCDAECDEENKCEARIEGDYCYFKDECDLNSCTCNYSEKEFCPEPGTIHEGYCYWGEKDCSEQGCTLNKTLMQGNNECDPLNGPKDTEAPIPPILYSSVSGNSITLTWINASDNVAISHYIVFRAEDSVFQDISGNLSSNQTSFVDSGLQYSKTYHYFVSVFDTSGNSANSSVINVTTEPKPLAKKPEAPVYYIEVCVPEWICSEWSACNEKGIQTRVCYDKNNCGKNETKPKEVQSCVYFKPVICEESWFCTDWSECTNKTRTRFCFDLNNCNTTLNKPIEIEECEEEVKPEEVPLGITGMLVALFFNPITAFLIFLIFLVIILVFLTIKLEKKK
ncbi:MAG: DNRLRE domain-containing protein [Candidatus Aenigmatarchaeota archaeon]